MRARLTAAVCCVVIVGAVCLGGCSSTTAGIGQPTSTVVSDSATPTPTPAPPATPIPTDLGALGWKQSPAPKPDAVAVAPSAPGTLYTCTGAVGVASGHISFSVSTDGGATWRQTSTPIVGGVCGRLAVSPTAPRAVALYATSCRGDCGGYPIQTLSYTLDAGAHWTQAYSTQDQSSGVFGWLGTTLFVGTAPPGTPHSATQFLAASTNGSPFAWTSFPVTPGQIFATGGTVYVTGLPQGACTAAASSCYDLYASTDRGASWTHVTPTYQGNNVTVVALASGSGALFGFDARAYGAVGSYPLLRSTDGGHSWQALPMPASSATTDSEALVTPDGTAYVVFFDMPSPQGIYALAPGAAQWKLVSPVVPADLHLVAVSSDAAGHPVALWGLARINQDDNALWTHAA